MSNEIARLNNQQSRLEEESVTGSFIPGIKLQHGVSKAVVAGEATPGDFLLGDENLGKAFRGWICSKVRPTALEFDSEFNLVRKSHDMDSTDYAEIAEQASRFVQGYSAGPEFLVYLVDAKRFGLVHFARSAKARAAGAFAALKAGRLAHFTAAPHGKRNVLKPVITMSDDQNFDMPSADSVTAAESIFLAYLDEETTDAPQRAR